MMRSTRWINNTDFELSGGQSPRQLSFIMFLKRYPIFLLAFGPPIFRPSTGIDATKGIIDFWSFFQVGLLGMVALRAILRIAAAKSILIQKLTRSILKYAFFLGLLYLASASYSPSRPVSAAYAILYILSWICVADFLIDVYRHPPDWMQCIFHLRLIAFLLYVVVLLTLLIKPSRVMGFVPGVGIRLNGGAVAPAGIICPIIAFLSLYMFLYSLEEKRRAAFFFIVGVVGTITTRSRGSEIALVLCLAIVGALWARESKRFASVFISGFMAFLLIFGLVAESFGVEHLWSILNRNQSVEGITSASGRTDIWNFIIQYCMVHPQGMGYEAGFRLLFRNYSAPGLRVNPVFIGNAHNAFMQVLADAGWVAFAAYLVMLAKVITFGLRFAKKKTATIVASGNTQFHALRCALVLLIFCFVNGMESSDYLVPLRAAFYLQNIIVAVILGISANMLNASRSINADETGNRNDYCIDPL